MVGIVTTLSTLLPQSVDSQVEARKSIAYLINTDYITEVYVEGTVNSRIRYKFNIEEDRPGEFVFTVTATNAAVQALSDVALNTNKISLNVYEGIQTFDKIPLVTTTAWYFNVKDIVWAENDSTGAYSRIWICKGGKQIVPYLINHTIAEVVSLAATGQ